MSLKCNECNTDNPVDAGYCRNCGKLMVSPNKISLNNNSSSSEASKVVWKVLGTIFIIGLAIYLICEFSIAIKTGVIMGSFAALREIWKDS